MAKYNFRQSKRSLKPSLKCFHFKGENDSLLILNYDKTCSTRCDNFPKKKLTRFHFPFRKSFLRLAWSFAKLSGRG